MSRYKLMIATTALLIVLLLGTSGAVMGSEDGHSIVTAGESDSFLVDPYQAIALKNKHNHSNSTTYFFPAGDAPRITAITSADDHNIYLNLTASYPEEYAKPNYSVTASVQRFTADGWEDIEGVNGQIALMDNLHNPETVLAFSNVSMAQDSTRIKLTFVPQGNSNDVKMLVADIGTAEHYTQTFIR